jgi:hypothetical protein
MRFSNFLLALSVLGSSIAANNPFARRDGSSVDDKTPTAVDEKTAVEAKRFIVEFAQVSTFLAMYL